MNTSFAISVFNSDNIPPVYKWSSPKFNIKFPQPDYYIYANIFYSWLVHIEDDISIAVKLTINNVHIATFNITFLFNYINQFIKNEYL